MSLLSLRVCKQRLLIQGFPQTPGLLPPSPPSSPTKLGPRPSPQLIRHQSLLFSQVSRPLVGSRMWYLAGSLSAVHVRNCFPSVGSPQ